MISSGRISINIPMASSAKGLKEELEKIAKRRAVSISKIVEQFLTYAANNSGAIPREIENPRPKPGKHISTTVSISVRDKLTEQAKSIGRKRAPHCCFILECIISNTSLQKNIFS